MIGRQLANFRIERVLGHGGMGTVYYGQDIKLQRPVAIKVIDAGHRKKTSYIERFVQDARTDATGASPKICVQLSWDGGTTWTTAKSTTTLSSTEATYTLGSISDRWGSTWTSSNFSNTNFRIRVIDVASNASRYFFLDYVAVNVTYQP